MFEKKKLIKLISANSFPEKVLKTFFAVTLVLFQATFLFYIAYSLLPVVEAQHTANTDDSSSLSEPEAIYGEVEVNSDESIAPVDNEIIESTTDDPEISEITETIEKEINNSEALKSELDPISFSEIKPENDDSINNLPPNLDDESEVLDPACLELGINDERRCREYLNLVPECRAVEVLTQYQCDIFLSQDYRCQNLGLLENECERFLKFPIVCQEKSIIDPEECRTAVYRAALPQECGMTGINTHEACRQYLFESNLPQKCISAGISDETECRNLIKETEKIAPVCSAVGITDYAVCRSYQQKQTEEETCLKLGIEELNRCDNYFSIKNIDSDCAGIDDPRACDRELFVQYGLDFCAEAGISEETECRAYVINKSREKVICGNLSDWECENLLADNFIGRIARAQFVFGNLKNRLDSDEIITGSIEELYLELGEVQKSIPIADIKARVGVIRSGNRIEIIDSENINQTSPAMLTLDSDGDGLADDLEERLGTDPFLADSDADGYTDWEEVRSSYNPLGTGAFKKALSPIDRAVLSGFEIAQPLSVDETDSAFRVTVENLDIEENKDKVAYVFSGQAEPNSVVTLYIYSDMPLMVSAETDEYGNWRYELKYALSDGEHQVFVALNDDTGKIAKRGNPLNFFIKEAKAVSIDDFLPASQNTKKSGPESMINLYIVVSVMVAVIGILLFIIFLLNRKKQEEEL